MVGKQHKSLFESLSRYGEQCVATTESGTLSATQLLEMAAALASLLPDASPGSEVAFSFESDSMACVAALLATWSKGHTACLPENGKCENIMPLLKRERNVAFLHDTGVGLGTHVPTFLAHTEIKGPLEWEQRGDDCVALRAFLQPPVGEITQASYTEQELLQELERLIEATGMTADTHVISGLSPSALPSLLAGTLSALHCGATFAQKTAGALDPRAVEEHRWIATPAQARLLAQQPAESMGGVKSLLYVDGELDQRTSATLAERGLQTLAPPSLPLDKETPPLAKELLRIVLEQDEVRDAAVSLLPFEAGQSPCALIIVEAPPHREQELKELIAKHASLQGEFKLRVLESLPRDENGRLPDWRVFLLFRYGRNGAVMEPNLIWIPIPTDEPNQFKFHTKLPENYAFFEGHYTTYAVLAGGAQLHELAQACIKLVDPSLRGVRRLSGIKFLARIAPRDELHVLIRKADKPGDFQFEVMRGGTRCSAGRLEYFVEDGSGS
jgi:hypothetical protein